MIASLSPNPVQSQDIEQPTRLPCRDIIVMSCNLRTPQEIDSSRKGAWAHRRDFCVETIRRRKPEVIGFQECSRIQFEDVREAFPDFLVYGVEKQATDSGEPYNVILASPKFEKRAAGSYWLSESPYVAGSKSWDNSEHPRFVNWMTLRDRETDIEFRILNTHFDHRGQSAREHSAEMVVRDGNAFSSDLPQIFTGDLNAESSNRAIEILKAGGWVDSWELLHGPEEPGFTAHDFLGSDFVSEGPFGHAGKIDWIFYRGNLKPLWSEIIRDQHDGVYPSDHYFIVAGLRLEAVGKPEISHE